MRTQHKLLQSFSVTFILVVVLLLGFAVFGNSHTALANHCTSPLVHGASGICVLPGGTAGGGQQQTQFVPLVGIPGVTYDPTSPGNFGRYVNALYILAISIAAFLAVVRIIFAGVNYMMSDVVTDKGEAKKQIRGALIGLLIVLAAVLVLNTINPQLTNLDVFGRAGQISGSTSGVFNLVFPDGNGITLTDIINDPNDNRYGTTPTLTTCGTSGSISCIEATNNCMNDPGFITGQSTVQQSDPNTVICYLGGATFEACTTNNTTACIDSCVNDKGGTYDANNRGCTITNSSFTNTQTQLLTCPYWSGCLTWCQQTMNGTYIGRGQCRVSIPSGTSGNPITYNGQSVDTSITYTVNDPGTSNHQDTITIIGTTSDGRVQVQDSSGRQYPIGCALLTPPIPGCN